MEGAYVHMTGILTVSFMLLRRLCAHLGGQSVGGHPVHVTLSSSPVQAIHGPKRGVCRCGWVPPSRLQRTAESKQSGACTFMEPYFFIVFVACFKFALGSRLGLPCVASIACLLLYEDYVWVSLGSAMKALAKQSVAC